MLRCIACRKQMADERAEEGGARESGTPSRKKKTIKRLTIQMKNMVLKLSGARKQSKSSTGKKGNTDHFHSISEGVPSPYTGDESLRSTPAWEFTTSHYLDARSTVGLEGDIVLEDEDIVTKEWKGEVEPGVYITFVSLPHGVNHLKRVRFSQRVFTQLQAQIWWAENYDRILDLYKVHRYTENALDTCPKSDDELRDTSNSKKDQTPRSRNKPSGSNGCYPSEQWGQDGGFQFHVGSSSEPSTSYWEQRSISKDCGVEAEWVDQDEDGIYITIRKLN